MSAPTVPPGQLTLLPPLLPRYQPGNLQPGKLSSLGSQMERLVVDLEGEKVAVNGESGTVSLEMDAPPPSSREDFAFKLLFVPSGNAPTQMSGTIVYATTAFICESQPAAGTALPPSSHPLSPFTSNSTTFYLSIPKFKRTFVCHALTEALAHRL